METFLESKGRFFRARVSYRGVNNPLQIVNCNKTWNANLAAIFEAKFEGSFSEFFNV